MIFVLFSCWFLFLCEKVSKGNGSLNQIGENISKIIRDL